MLPMRKQAYRKKLPLRSDYLAQLVKSFNKLQRKSRPDERNSCIRPVLSGKKPKNRQKKQA